MRSAAPRYPVDRYLVDSSTKLEMVNITDDELWNPEPAIRPEDEMMLRKLHEMLQSTADDLKLISGELMKCREPRARIRAAPAPLDEQFNEKVHIEEIVNAKFHGYKIVEKPSLDKLPLNKPQNVQEKKRSEAKTKITNATVQVRPPASSIKVPRKKTLSIAPVKLVQIDEKPLDNSRDVTVNDVKSRNWPSVSYNEFSHTYTETKRTQSIQKPLRVQEMPSINIRSELREQKVLQLDIVPEQKDYTDNVEIASNVAVIALEHDEVTPGIKKNVVTSYPRVVVEASTTPATAIARPTVRRISKMLTCGSSDSSNNVSSAAQDEITTRNPTRSNILATGKPLARFDSNAHKSCKNKIDAETPPRRNLAEWKKKLNVIYRRPAAVRHQRAPAKADSKDTVKPKGAPTKSPTSVPNNGGPQNVRNNAEYIPYTKLTLGGIRVSDIEKEISDLPDKNIPLSPILDKILSRENSFQRSPRRKEQKNKNVLTTSDENLLEEVLDIERNITSTLSKNVKEIENKLSSRTSNISSENDQSDRASYADDFDEERSDNERSRSDENKSRHIRKEDRPQSNNGNNIHTNVQNTAYTKSSNLSFKSSVDVFEFVHSVDTRDNATQSTTTHKISLKATQTSPRSVRPIRNDLWSPAESRRPHGDIDEDFVKKLIVDECTDLLQKNLTKAAEGKDNAGATKNFAAFQKNTQTSPAHVKSIMTSPARTKTRTTSPIVLSLAVDHQTSPITFFDEENLHIELDKAEDLTVSINLSSPRFSLRLPQTSREVLSNLGAAQSKINEPDHLTKPNIDRKASSSSNSADDDYSSSDISSLGEINNEYKMRLQKRKVSAVFDSSATSIISKSSSDSSSNILPLKSEGEVSVGRVSRRQLRFNKSDGEVSIGQRA